MAIIHESFVGCYIIKHSLAYKNSGSETCVSEPPE